MVYGLVMAVHIMVALFLVGVVLLQGGRGGMSETLGGAGAQSLFGGGANIVMAKITTVAASLFMATCLSLAMLSTARGRSVIDRLPMMPEDLPLGLPTLPPAAVPGLPASDGTDGGSQPDSPHADRPAPQPVGEAAPALPAAPSD
jgi:preprotein translocase subunit SecG